MSRRAGVELETSGQEEVRDKGVKGVTSAAAEAFSFLVADESFAGGFVPFRRVSSLVYGLARNSHGPRKALVSSLACILVII